MTPLALLKAASLATCAVGVMGSGAPVVLTQEDFKQGTLIITEPGVYVLGEDIEFRPQGDLQPTSPETWMFPDISKAPYNASPYRLGFFCAIAIAADDVTLDLAGHTLSQSPEHALMQRFFALIELANSPFPPDAGPAAFVGKGDFVAAKNVEIKNGVLGLSSHHGIHGNNNVGVVIRDLEVTNFEVAGISLNQVDNLLVENVKIHSTRRAIPVNGRLSNSIFLLQAISKHLQVDTSFDGGITGPQLIAAQESLRQVVHKFLSSSQDTDRLFASSVSGMPDASLVSGLIVHSGVNVGNFLTAQPEDPAADIKLYNVTIQDLAINPTEIGTLVRLTSVEEEEELAPSAYKSNTHSHDAIGAVFDIDFCTEDYNNTVIYKHNALAHAQLAFAAYADACLQEGSGCSSAASPREAALLRRNTITPMVVDWANGVRSWEDILGAYRVEPNHDVMFHRVKGMVGLKLDGVLRADVRGVVVRNLSNMAGERSRSKLAVRFAPFHLYDGFSLRAVSVTASVDVDLSEIAVGRLHSEFGRPSCADLLHDFTNVTMSSVVSFKGSSPPVFSKPAVADPQGMNEGSTIAIALGSTFGVFVGLLVLIVGGLFWRRAVTSAREEKDQGDETPSEQHDEVSQKA